jgi:glycosyltransferase involved in cell wall biosynthesis
MFAEIPWYGFREQLEMPMVAKAAKADLVHWTHWNVPLRSPQPFVVTIHDLIQFGYPSARATTLGPIAYKAKRLVFGRVLQHAVRQARRILVPTAFVQNSVAERFPFAVDRIRVTGEGAVALPDVDEAFVEKTLRRLGIARKYILTLGNAYPHKNLEGALAAFASLRKEHPDSTYVVAGHDDWFFRRLRTEAAAGGNDAGVVFVPSPDDLTAAALYRGATLYFAPSFEEGFGLPPLEAMRVGVPVVASNAGSFPEVLGDAAIYVDPYNVGHMADVLGRMFVDCKAQERMRVLGLVQVSRWRWQDAAEKTRIAYREAIG